MRYHIESGRLVEAQWVESPNCDARSGQIIDLIVIHGMSLPPNQFGGEGVVQLFTNQLNSDAHPYYAEIANLRVSAHLFIRRDGQIIQFVNFDQRAWHAGVSRYQGRSACNDFSIGIELEGGDAICYTASQYQALALALKALLNAYPTLDEKHIVGHSDIAPGRKTDPGPLFNWRALFRLLNNS
ncbi:1,6-anhydro-N-acetylmuramyl-L-alanine amidase AmpD [Thiomicrospira microaerophila]|uniref:1,6-anhydro-N-acetylmuramyl-L-alanine amidase AmpD n=1 Tax=Thiomicrospira microaerophila TaxID=406020 RepID=UPI000A5FCAC9|nr:1,6-anhydro-N-acetylmuramyl-L-alanine amidase AmpD [Thiomicrospira microaerophila]